MKRYLTFLAIVFAIGGLAQALCRHIIKAGGEKMFYEYDGNQFVIGNKFFQGVHCGKIFKTVLEEESKVIDTLGVNVLNDAAETGNPMIWFGPRLGWSYAAWGIKSPKGPLFWEPGTAFAAKDRERLFAKFMDQRYNVLVLFKGCELGGYSDAEQRAIEQAYNIDGKSFQTLIILTRKK
jgi:hypothetical protein